MYALGVDAYRLYPRLKQLHEVAESRMYGESGTLRLNAERHIERQLIWAQFRRGKATTLPMIANYEALKAIHDAETTIPETLQ